MWTVSELVRGRPRRLLLAACALLVLAGARAAYADAAADYKQGAEAYNRDDVITAMTLLRRATDAGNVKAMTLLAYILDKSEENEEAFRLYQRAAGLGSKEATLAVGAMYATGEGVARDPKRALEWINKAATAGYEPAMVALAKVYLEGKLGVVASRAKGMAWLERAAAAGYEPAKTELEKLRRPKKPVPATTKK